MKRALKPLENDLVAKLRFSAPGRVPSTSLRSFTSALVTCRSMPIQYASPGSANKAIEARIQRNGQCASPVASGGGCILGPYNGFHGVLRMLRIAFPTDNPHGYPILYFGERCRYSTMTSVRLLSPNRLLAANYIQHRLYLVDFDMEAASMQICESIETRIGEDHGPTDLLDFDEQTGVICLSHFLQCGASYYRLAPDDAPGPVLQYLGALQNRQIGPAHGIAFDRSRPRPLRTTVVPGIPRHLVLSTSHTRNPNAGTYALDLGSIDSAPTCWIHEPGWLSKDLCFCGQAPDGSTPATHVVNLFCDYAPKPGPNRTYRVKIGLYRLTSGSHRLEKCDEHLLPDSHCDSCAYDGRYVYVTTESEANRGEVQVYEFDATAERLRPVGAIPGYNFPHGVDVRYGLLAVTEYGNCDVVVEPLEAAFERLVPA